MSLVALINEAQSQNLLLCIKIETFYSFPLPYRYIVHVPELFGVV